MASLLLTTDLQSYRDTPTVVCFFLITVDRAGVQYYTDTPKVVCCLLLTELVCNIIQTHTHTHTE